MTSHYGVSQSTDISQRLEDLMKTLETYHLAPPEIDESFTKRVGETLSSLIDPQMLILSSEDKEMIASIVPLLGVDHRQFDVAQLEKVRDIYNAAIKDRRAHVESLTWTQLNFQVADTLRMVSDEITLDDELIRSRWEKLIKLDMMTSYVEQISGGEPSVEGFQDKLASLYDRAYSKVMCFFEGMNEDESASSSFIEDSFLRAISMSFDQHSVYLSSRDKEGFVGDLTQETLSFGFDVSPNVIGDLEVVQIIPGGPAWLSNEINEGDIIRSARDVRGNSYDFVCAKGGEVAEVFGSSEVMDVTFKIIKKSSEEIEVRLQKAELEVEDNKIQSYILEDEKRLAYIYLPSFYTSSLSHLYFGEGCSKDLATELIRLKREKVEGLILDLRDNGGGSLQEAVQIAGIFVSHGGVALLKDDEKVHVLKDPNRGQLYNQPLVVMINGHSASASELLAASLKDHNRAILVGTPSYGKGTSQVIMPIDAHSYSSRDYYKSKSEDFVKITTGAFYNVQGENINGSGIHPDILLPDTYYIEAQKEKKKRRALHVRDEEKKVYYYPYDALPIKALRERSKERISKRVFFQNIENEHKTKPIILSFDFIKELVGKEAEMITEDQSFSLEVQLPSYIDDIDIFESDDSLVYKKNLINLQKDVYIHESYHILKDLINQTKK